MLLPAFREVMVDWPEFVEFWSRIYQHEDEDRQRPDREFLDHLRWPHARLSAVDVDFLFEWKNGGRLSAKKGLVPRRTKRKLAEFNGLRRGSYDDIKGLAEDCTEGSVWMRFICHIVSPESVRSGTRTSYARSRCSPK